MTFPVLCLDSLLFFGLVFGLGLPWVAGRRRLDPAEQLTLGAAGGVLLLYLAAWIIYLAELPATAFLVLPAAAGSGVLLRRRQLGEIFRDAGARWLAGALVVFAAWCLGWLALVRSYSGGEWSADWLEHFQRAHFFLDRAPLDQLFNGIYGLAARPPLANLVVAAGLGVRAPAFAHFQVFSTLLAALVLLPTFLLGRGFAAGRPPGTALLAALMFSPFVIQNATFPWTKLPCTLLVLTATAFYVRGLDDVLPWRRHVAFLAMAGAILAHYSAVPYALALAALQLVRAARAPQRRAALAELATQGALAGLLLLTWFYWAMRNYGYAGAFLSNSTATADAGQPWLDRVLLRLHVLFVTLVPHPLRAADYGPIAQTSQLGFIRDYFFNIYQTTLPGALGLAGLVWLAARLRLEGIRTALPPRARFWAVYLGAAFVLSIATVSWPDRWGVIHIGLGSFVLIVLAWLSAAWPRMSRGWRAGWIAALLVDGALGIALQFYLEATATLEPGDVDALFHHATLAYSQVAMKNLVLKKLLHLDFVADGGPPPLLVAAFLAGLALLVLQHLWRERAPRPPG